MTKDDIIAMAREAGLQPYYDAQQGAIERFAALVATAERQRADALAATVGAIRDLVTHDHESKADFVRKVRAVLGADPDDRVLRAVEAEREACIDVVAFHGGSVEIEAAIRARGKP